MRIQRRSGWTIGRAGALLARLALVVAAPAATAIAAKPVPGGQYYYHQPPAPLGTDGNVRIGVGRGNVGTYVSWKLKGGAGCKQYLGGRSSDWFNSVGGVSRTGATGVKVIVKANGSFYGALHTPPAGPLAKYMKSYLAEVRGLFVANGQAAQVSVRLKYLDYRSANNSFTCDGRWLKFRAPLEAGIGRP